MLWAECGKEAPVGETSPFNDVKKDSWYYNAVSWCYNNGCISGTSSTTFSPSSKLTRAQLVTILSGISDDRVGKYLNQQFKDVKESAWYFCPVNWAYLNNKASGVGGNKFDPNGKVTREQTAVMLKKFSDWLCADVALGTYEYKDD